MAMPLNLNCWILGEDSTRIFPIEIDDNKNVGALKKAIKEEMKPAFDHITADSLDVWNVSIPLDEDMNLETKVKNLRIFEKKPLWALKGLRKIFRDLDTETLHVVVKAPPIIRASAPSLLLLNCWVFGEDSTRIFPIEIDSNKNIGALKKAIKEEMKPAFDRITANSLDVMKPAFDHITADSLDVWNVSIPLDEDVNLETKVKNLRIFEKKPLWALKELRKIFRDLDTDTETLHVVVKAPPILRLNCWVLGEDSARIFSVRIDGDNNVSALKEAIKEVNKPTFDHINANSLDLWNVSIQIDGGANLGAQVKNLKVLETKPLLPVQPLSGIFRNVVKQYLHVIVRASTAGDNDLARVDEHVGDIANVTLYVKEFNKWTPEDLQHPYNNILLHFTFDNAQPSLSSTSNVVFPPYTKALLDGLARKRELPRGDEVQHAFLKATLGDHFIRFFDEVEEPGDTSEVRAYITAIKDCAPNVSIIKEKSSYFKERHFTVFLVDPVFRELPLYDKGVSADPAMVIKQVNNGGDPRSYSPNSDFLLNTSYVPIIINETISPTNESDRCRMLLQAMVYVRVGNYLRTSRNLVILCFYLNTNLEAERYLVYQASTDDTNRVEIVHDRKFALSEPLQAFEFLFQLFNYKDTLPAVLDGFDEAQANATKTVSKILRHAYRSISSKNESQKSGSRTKGKKSRGGHSHELETIQEHKAALMLYGYKIVAPMKNHRHIAFAKNHLHEEFVLKIVDRDELDFMNYLSSPQMLSDPRNHTVPFSHVTGIGHGKSVIAMPKLLPLDDVPLYSLQTAQCYNLLRQLVEGFTFLHGHDIAHLDLKSANIVIDTSLERLYIIDFGLAHKVNGIEDTVSGFRGTKQWVAPEVDDDGYPYSAIRADLWAVGELIRTVLVLWHKGPAPNNGLEEISTQLLSTDPLKRPILDDIFSKFDFSDHKRVSSHITPLIQPDLYNRILLQVQ